ncbi:MAG: NADH-quinone oxidoreductase subunit C [Candidatus Diapherotrites archaeon]|uniref:NADH-quinone oxidoreductase subunit C n=1 Tax=Candidatus Iainarchaeum sp. TaxID=3101447 RepID=A0A939C6A7_9ARCH|nr:NADH-quinone oxidoreductase subunit C [Candidatus Diapherotrites archaeon]
MKAEQVLASFKKRFKLKEARIDNVMHRANRKSAVPRIWIEIGREEFKEAVGHLCELHPMPHFAVASGYQIGEIIELIYHFSLNYGKPQGEICIGIKTKLEKGNASIPTITGLVPGALISEREIQEMLGVKVEGIPDSRRLFLPKNFPKKVYPWRRDETGPNKIVRNMHKGEKK